MKSMRIVLTKSTKKVKFFSDLIIWWDRYRYKTTLGASHVAGKWTGHSWERDFIYQASGSRTNFMGGTYFYRHNLVIEEYELDLPDEVEAAIGRSCIDREGKPYAIKQTVGIFISGVVWLFTLGRIDMDNPFKDGDSETNCLEEWAIILSEHLEVPAPQCLEKATPSLFRSWLRTLPNVKQIYPSQ